MTIMSRTRTGSLAGVGVVRFGPEIAQCMIHNISIIDISRSFARAIINVYTSRLVRVIRAQGPC